VRRCSLRVTKPVETFMPSPSGPSPSRHRNLPSSCRPSGLSPHLVEGDPGFTVEAERGVPATATYVNALGRGSPTGPSRRPVLQKYLTVDQTQHWADPLTLECVFKPPAEAAAAGCASRPTAIRTGPASLWRTHGPREPQSRPSATSTAAKIRRTSTAAPSGGTRRTGGARCTPRRGSSGRPTPPCKARRTSRKPRSRAAPSSRIPDVGVNPTLCSPTPTEQCHPFWTPEFFGDAIVVNGKTWPFPEVEPRR
jgi:spore coat protein A